ncbi:UNVERIFIED_CONTAM: hypothetical protein FKN15_063059 [Acipenser sinensis]
MEDIAEHVVDLGSITVIEDADLESVHTEEEEDEEEEDEEGTLLRIIIPDMQEPPSPEFNAVKVSLEKRVKPERRYPTASTGAETRT